MKQKLFFKNCFLLMLFAFLSFQVKAQVYTFTPAGATGIDGPTQTQVNAAYLNTPLSNQVTVSNGIQIWRVPISGTYKIEALGANGYGPFGGRGAYISGEFYFDASDEIRILVGQEGGCCVGSGTNQYGGGGGTFIVDDNDDPLIVAGGGVETTPLPNLLNELRVG